MKERKKQENKTELISNIVELLETTRPRVIF